MKQQLIRLTESDLHRIVKEAVNTILNEVGETDKGQYLLGRLAGRNSIYDYDKYNDVMDYAKQKRNGDENKLGRFTKGFHDEENKIRDGWRRTREERDFYNEFGNQSQYPANEFMPPFEGELSMTAQYSPEDYERRMSDWDPEYFLDGKDEIYKSKLPGDYRTKK